MPLNKNKRARPEAGDSDNELPRADSAKKTSKKQKTASNTAGTTAIASKNDSMYWELGNKRRITVSKFNNTILVNIREYYEKNGEMLPGKKGISLSTPQWQTLITSIGGINAALRAEGIDIEGTDDEKDREEDLEMVLEADPVKKTRKTAAASANTSKQKKSNIEATSDEDGEDNDADERDNV